MYLLVALFFSVSWSLSFAYGGNGCDPTEPNVFYKYLLGRPPWFAPPDEDTFNYGGDFDGPDNWPHLYEQCGGEHQSPININSLATKYTALRKLTWDRLYRQTPQQITVTNNGLSVNVVPTYTNSLRPAIQGGPLPCTYYLQDVHFHWGSTNSRGSEHSINGKVFPMEMHAVHIKQNLTLEQAMRVPDGIAVVAYFVEIEDTINEAFDNLQQVFESLANEVNVTETIANPFPISQLAVPFCGGFVTYQGSLTTPPCSESVLWIISSKSIGVSREQLDNFRSLYSSTSKLVDNFRPTQDQNGRRVVLSIM